MQGIRPFPASCPGGIESWTRKRQIERSAEELKDYLISGILPTYILLHLIQTSVRTPLLVHSFKLPLSHGRTAVIVKLSGGCNLADSFSVRTVSKSIPLESDWKILVKGILGDVTKVNEMDEHDMYPLSRAAIIGIPGLVQEVLDLGADVHARNKRGWTALEFAARNGKPEVVRLLAKHGAKIADRDDDGWSPIERAILMGEFDCVKALVELGCDVNETDSNKISPLWLAARHGRSVIARYLIGRGADVTAVDDSGFTPFHIAIKHNEMEVVRILKDEYVRIVAEDAEQEFQRTGKEIQLEIEGTK